MEISSYFALFGAGLLTFASPCVLPLLPVYLAVLGGAQVGGDPAMSKRRLRYAGLGFAVGLAVVFIALGMGASALASSLSQHRRTLELVAGFVMLLFGAKLLGIVKLPWFERESRPLLDRVPAVGGFWGGLLFGAAFAVGWTPCVGPVLGAALTYAATSAADPLAAGALLAAYAFGLATPLLLASFAASALIGLTRRLRSAMPIIQRVTGGLLVAVGLLLANGQLSSLAPTADKGARCDSASSACDLGGATSGTMVNANAMPRGPQMVEFTSGHCTVCEKMKPVVSELERYCAAGLITRVSVDDDAGRSLADRFGVTLVPTFLSIDASGREVERVVGALTREQLVVALSELRGAPCDAKL